MAERVPNRWIIVGAAMIGLISSGGPVNNFSFSMLLKPITEELGIPRDLYFAPLLTSFFTALIGLVIGIPLQRFGGRRVLLPGILLFALVTAAQSLLSPSLIVIYTLFALRGIASPGESPIVYSFIITQWFDRRRGLALGIALAGVGLGTAVIPQIVGRLLDAYGWRVALAGTGVAILLIAGLPALFFIRDRPDWERARSAGTTELALPGVTVRQALAQWRFWAMAFAFFFGVVAVNGVIQDIVPLLTDRGLSPQAARSVLSASGIAAIVGRIGSGWCVDRIHGPKVAIAFYALLMIGAALFISGLGAPVPLIGTVLCGLALGAEIDLMAFFVSRYFGLKNYGKVFGIMFSIFAGSTQVGPTLANWFFGIYHGYTQAFILFEVGLVIALFLFLPLGSYPYPAPRHPRAVTAEKAAT